MFLPILPVTYLGILINAIFLSCSIYLFPLPFSICHISLSTIDDFYHKTHYLFIVFITKLKTPHVFRHTCTNFVYKCLSQIPRSSSRLTNHLEDKKEGIYLFYFILILEKGHNKYKWTKLIKKLKNKSNQEKAKSQTDL